MKGLTFAVISLSLLCLSRAETFFPEDGESNVRPQKRSLLQATEEQELRGPETFFHKGFLLKVKKGIVVNVFEGGNSTKIVDRIVLDQPAVSVKASFINTNRSMFSVTLTWKDNNFAGKSLRLKDMLIQMDFFRKKKEFTMTSLKADRISTDQENIADVSLQVRSKDGYKVSAPIGSAFECSDIGMFAPVRSENRRNNLNVGLTFPDMKIQVFEINTPKFGPSWSCGTFFTIGVWVGLIITFLFALVCYWGFSMLANIQTMDRFDDPKGIPIHVPQGE